MKQFYILLILVPVASQIDVSPQQEQNQDINIYDLMTSNETDEVSQSLQN